MDDIEKLQNWYRSSCDGEWEHQYGVVIDTIDNPGWSVTVDLTGTRLGTAKMDAIRLSNGDEDWLCCEIKEGKFVGAGDPLKLRAILAIFYGILEKSDAESG